MPVPALRSISVLLPMLNFLHPDTSFPADFPSGTILLIDKPLGWTSFDVVNKVRYQLVKRLGNKKLKVGHAGTLDPLATGLLVVCVGDYTKRIDTFQATEKEYTGTITFGATTPSFDLEKAVDATYPIAHLTDALLETVHTQFLGDMLQVPPIFSAVKVDGRRLYKNARTGEEVELPHRPVHIKALEISPLRPAHSTHIAPHIASAKGAIMLHPDYAEGLQCDFRVICSKGTYIRSLAHDLGQAAGSGAYLSALKRTRSGDFSVENAWDMTALIEWIENNG